MNKHGPQKTGWPDECSPLTVVICIVCRFPQSLLVVLDASFCTETVLSLRKDGGSLEESKGLRACLFGLAVAGCAGKAAV
jgi:hypothetical protein